MRTSDNEGSWHRAIQLLEYWHENNSRAALKEALSFMELHLRAWTPVSVAESDQEDILQEFLRKLIEKRLPEKIENPISYIRRAYRNHGIDWVRQQQRIKNFSEKMPIVFSNPPSPLDQEVLMEQKESEYEVRRVIEGLKLEERVLLKLRTAPYWINSEELSWLSNHCGQSSHSLEAILLAPADTASLAALLYPHEYDLQDPESRRKLLDRFNTKFRRLLGLLRSQLCNTENNHA